ncbi:MAG: SUMF1/EgtB/PvdO family nonheme iron enzyme [Myxococcales bacterium]|nr:SUMF1/EgtB/PvdO family nonheme iron enzyme [Myxococcota bacterium]MDW8284173.1 SUMF1/EgtB/PvdO family nonheme iron enzyme [Myxococcales bacterium]
MIEVGQVVDSYRVTRKIGEGGMGVVFEAVHEQIGRRAAIKVLHPHLSQNPQIAIRFLNEARAANVIEHPGKVEIFEYGQLPDGTAYIIMEFLKGPSLATRLQQQGPAGVDALLVARQVASVLAAAHAKGIVHRDLKPDNVKLVADPETPGGERAKLLDFGIAKVAEELQKPDGAQVKTQAGTILGTPTYMSPEQCRGARDVTDRSDVYSLGVMLFEMLTGVPPFRSDGIGELLAMHMFQPPPDLMQVRPGTPPALAALVNAMLAKDPADRPSMNQVIAELERLGAAKTGTIQAVDEPLEAPTGTMVREEDGGARPALPPGGRQGASPLAPRRGPPRALLVGALLAALSGMGVLGAMALRLRRGAALPEVLPPRPPPSHTEGRDRPTTRGQTQGPVPPPGMVWLPPAVLSMGSTPAEIEAAFAWCQQLTSDCRRDIYEREAPVHTVRLSGFFLDQREVSNEEFTAWLNRQPRLKVQKKRLVFDGKVLLADLHPARGRIAYVDGRFVVTQGAERTPVVQITWAAAHRYCQAQGKALPTEAQWEYAARGTSRRRFPWGNGEPTCQGVVFGRMPQGACASAGDGTAPAGTSRQDMSPEGIFDLGGNVAEWVQDRFVAPYPDCAGECVDPVVEDKGAPGFRVIRGGDWGRPAESCRAAGRSRAQEDRVQVNVGFRCAAPAPAGGTDRQDQEER